MVPIKCIALIFWEDASSGHTSADINCSPLSRTFGAAGALRYRMLRLLAIEKARCADHGKRPHFPPVSHYRRLLGRMELVGKSLLLERNDNCLRHFY